MYHKIRNIEKTVCTCEQKVAYNIAFAASCQYKKAFQLAPTAICKDEVVRAAIDYCMKRNDTTKYDKDLIFCALNAGMKNYLASKYSILTTYEEIGKMFPANYL